MRWTKKLREVRTVAAIGCGLLGFALFDMNRGAYAQVADDQEAALAVPLQKSRSAMDQCREQRLRGQIANYRDSALCSNPKIYAAWQDAGYPYMDLISAWLTAREVGSDKVDKGQASAEEFERQMAELTRRVTQEERNRRASGSGTLAGPAQGSANYVAGLSALQAPIVQTASVSPTETVRPAAPPLRLVPSPQRTTIARAQPAATDNMMVSPRTQPARPAAPPVVMAATTPAAQSTGLYSPNPMRFEPPATFTPTGQTFQTASRSAPAAVGGPYVPAESASTTTTRSSQVRTASYSADDSAGGAYVQVSSQRSQAEAQSAFGSLRARFPNVLGNKQAVIRRAELGSKGTFYRAQIGPMRTTQAKELCSDLKAAGGECFIQSN